MADFEMNDVEMINTEREKINAAAKRGHRIGVFKGLDIPTSYMLSLPFETHREDGLREILMECMKMTNGWFRGVFSAVEGTYTNKKGKEHACWYSINNKYLKPKKEGETKFLYTGYEKWDEEKYEFVFTSETYQLAQAYKTLGALIIPKEEVAQTPTPETTPTPEPETTPTPEPETTPETTPEKKMLKIKRRRILKKKPTSSVVVDGEK